MTKAMPYRELRATEAYRGSESVKGRSPRNPSLASLSGLPLSAWVAVVLLGAIVTGSVIDTALPSKAALLPLVVAPFVAAVLLPLRATVLIAGVSLVLIVVLPQAIVTPAGFQYFRLAAVAALDVLAVVSTMWREHLAQARARLIREQERAVVSRRHALELNDTIYQSLFTSRLWADMGEAKRADVAFDRALHGTAELLAELLVDVPVHPGALLRSLPPPVSERLGA